MAVAILCGAACNDGALGPASSGTPGGPRLRRADSGGTESQVVAVVRRTTPLAKDISVARTIGYAGGTIQIPEAGLKVDFPAGAVLWKTTITVTAIAGSTVAYEFSPHGQIFLKSVTVMQSLKGTDVFRTDTPLQAAYFENISRSLLDQGLAVIDEFFPVTQDTFGSQIAFHIHHFSGYLVSSGKNVN